MSAQRYDAASLESEEVLIHARSYDVKTYRVNDETIRLEGRVTDRKPAGMFIADDPEDLYVHDMTVSMVVSFPRLQINSIDVGYAEFPHSGCPGISSAYQALVGQSIASGFTRFVNENFGRERGCTHVGSLLKAMAPVAVQSIYSMRRLPHDEHGPRSDKWTPEEHQRSMSFTLNSCHIWDEDGDLAKSTSDGSPPDTPVWLTKRLAKLGRSDEIGNW